MPDQNLPTPPEFADEYVMLAIEPPTESRATVRVSAAGDGVRAVIEMSLPAAEHLSAHLRAVTVAATAAADYLTDEEDQP